VGRIRRLLAHALLFLAVAAASIAVSLWATPMQQVSAAGQTVQVGVAPPSLDLSGPGQLVLFGQQLPTSVQFEGPVRPRLVLSRITLSEQLAQLTAQDPRASARELEDALVSGWRRYFVWQIVVVGLCAIVFLGAIAGWLRHGAKRTVKLIVIGLVIAEAIDMGAIMITASSTPQKLRGIHSLHDLVGDSTTPTTLPGDPIPSREIRKVAVIGDSTAAGQGNRSVPHPTKDDKACHRSADAFGENLARTDAWDVTNLACGGATVENGLLGPQWVGDRMQNPQLDAPAVAQADVVIVSIGANDVRWADLLRLCAVANSCANQAAQAYFQQQLAGFSRNLLDLLSRLQLLKNHPIVLVNQYYDPFDPDANCLTELGMTESKRRTLEADLSALNTLLANAAKTAGFLSVRPDFADHGVCAPESYVQGVHDKAPFHPNASGQLAIALADDNALHGSPSPPAD
jgi:lysophospholipase L1-like esterase